MKVFNKIFLCCMLATVMIFGVACGGNTDNSSMPTEDPEELVLTKNTDDAVTLQEELYNKYSEYINYRNPLLHTYGKLEAGKTVNVVYFGGSVTNGTGSSNENSTSWRGLIGSYLSELYPGQVCNYNRAWGGTGSYFAAMRTKRDVNSVAPDLLFIEFSINDKYCGNTYEQAAQQYETIVRQVRDEYPNCDIVTLLVTDNQEVLKAKNGTLHEQAQAHEDMAKKYNISTLHIGRYLSRFIARNWSSDKDDENDPTHWEYYMTDVVHPNDRGYKLYANVVEEYLKNTLAPENNGEEVLYNYEMPDIISESLLNGEITVISGNGKITENIDAVPSEGLQTLLLNSQNSGGYGFLYNDSIYNQNNNYIGYLEMISPMDPNGNYDVSVEGELVIPFFGTELAISTSVADKASVFEYSIDGKDYVKKNFYNNGPFKVVSDLEAREHILKIKVSFAGITETYLKNTLKGVIKIGIVMTRDAMQATAPW